MSSLSYLRVDCNVSDQMKASDDVCRLRLKRRHGATCSCCSHVSLVSRTCVVSPAPRMTYISRKRAQVRLLYSQYASRRHSLTSVSRKSASSKSPLPRSNFRLKTSAGRAPFAGPLAPYRLNSRSPREVGTLPCVHDWQPDEEQSMQTYPEIRIKEVRG